MKQISLSKRTEIFFISIFFVVVGGIYLLALLYHSPAKTVSAGELSLWIEKHHPLLIDVRESNELLHTPLPFNPSLHLPFLMVYDRVNTLAFLNTRPLLFICSDGNRSRYMATLLAKRGFNTFYLKFGLNAYNRNQKTKNLSSG